MTGIGPDRRATERAFKRLTAAEAQQALYIDFEGVTNKPPVLLGTLHKGGRGPEPFVFQVVVDPEFRATGTDERPFKDAIRVVVQRAEAGDRRIVAWSQHELDVVQQLLADEPELVDRFASRYANALGVAKRWANKLHAEAKPARGELGAYLSMIEYEVPPGGGPGHVGDTIRALRPTLAAGRPLTPRQKARWTRLLKHNRYDCAGMKAICLLATRELEAAACGGIVTPSDPPRQSDRS